MSTLNTILISSLVGAASSAAVLVAGSVSLQDASPGVTETGHSNISGYSLAGRFGAGVSPTLAKIQVLATGSLQGVRSLTDTGVAVYGQSNAATGLGAGGYFTSKSDGGRAAVVDQLSPTGNTIGLFANAVSITGTGVHGRGKAKGVVGEATGTNGAGVTGISSYGSQQTSGGYFEAAGSSPGIISKTMNGFNSGPAGLFESQAGNYTSKFKAHGTGAAVSVSALDCGIAAFAGGVNTSLFNSKTAGAFSTNIANGFGTAAYATGTGGIASKMRTASGTGYGVLAENAGGGAKVAVRALGNTEATGTKAFVIDHPLAPGEKYLRHFSAEGPEPYLVYRGTARIGANGKVWVSMPSYYSSIATDPHYQLTAIGSPAQVFVATEMQSNRFQIGGPAGLKVCWTVTATRNDATVQKYGFQTESSKSDVERGKFLDPTLYGAKPERAIHPDPQVTTRD